MCKHRQFVCVKENDDFPERKKARITLFDVQAALKHLQSIYLWENRANERKFRYKHFKSVLTC